MGYQAEVVTSEKTVSSSNTPEPLSASKILTQDAVVQAKNSNTQMAYIGGAGAQFFELEPGDTISLSDVVSQGSERMFDLQKIYAKVSVDGEGVNILYTKLK